MKGISNTIDLNSSEGSSLFIGYRIDDKNNSNNSSLENWIFRFRKKISMMAGNWHSKYEDEFYSGLLFNHKPVNVSGNSVFFLQQIVITPELSGGQGSIF